MNRAIPDSVVDEIRARADIAEVVQSYIPLKKAGQAFKACCPFHQEKTPSFTVNPARQIFHCFGCGKGGDVFRFVMERENVDFPNAIHILARRYNVIIPEPERRSRGDSGEPPPAERANFKERLYLIHEKFQSWFQRNLLSGNGAVADYLATRGLPEEAVKDFGLGASLDAWDAGLSWARREGFTDDELLAAGLTVESQDNPDRRYDRFRNRLMFPIWNEQGRVVAFSARSVEKDPQGGKYVNSPETLIFRKGRILYGLHKARQEMGSKGFALLCEGQLDVMAMHRAGFKNAVAPQGTAFTEEQALILKRYTDSLVFALDSDSAGVKAVFRAAEVALPTGLNLKVVSFPSGKDPDELLKTGGAEAIEGAVSGAKDFFEFALDRLLASEDASSPSGRAAAASEVLRLISFLESEVAKASYVSWLAGRMSLDTPSMMAELRKISSKAQFRAQYQQKAPSAEARQETDSKASLDERLRKALCDLLDCILSDGLLADLAQHELQAETLNACGAFGRAVETVLQAKLNGEWEEAPRMIVESFRGETPPSGLAEILAKDQSSSQSIDHKLLEKVAKDCIRIVKASHLRSEIASLKSRIASAPEGDERNALLKEFTEKSRAFTRLN